MMSEQATQEAPTETASPVTINPDREHHEHIHDILMDQDEITWQSIIKELIKSEQMDPWDVNVSKLSKMFIKTLKKFKEMNLHVSGKVLLCAALLLRIKSSRLVGDDMMEFDRLLASGDNQEDLYSDEEFMGGELGAMGMKLDTKNMQLIPKTPQPRKRKVSVYDLIDALAIALTTRRRRILNNIDTKEGPKAPDKSVDISALMNDLYHDVVGYLNRGESDKIAFSQLAPPDSRMGTIHTFIPLLHLTNARKVDLDQQKHFGEIWVTLAKEEKKKEGTAEKEPVEEKQDAESGNTD